jgi:hypothetical protein
MQTREKENDKMVMFYEGYYLAQNPDVAKAVESGAFGTGWEHYKAFGQVEGRAMDAPAAYGDFNEEYYLANNADVAKAVDAGTFGTGWEHYSLFGQGEERSTAAPTGYGDFNEEYYLAGNADVARAVETGAFGTGWEHYSLFGQGEGRSTAAPDGYADFNEHCYLANNPDVAKAVDAGSFGTGWEHYSLFGQTEERSFSAPVSGGDEHQPTEFPPAVMTPTFTLTTDAPSVDEGATATFTLATTNVAEGTELAYTLSGTGIDAADIVGGALTGVATVGADGTAAIDVALAADTTTEGLETLSVALDNGEATATADINDTSLDPSTPTYTLTPAAPSVDEGATATFTLATTNVDEGTALAYTLSGTGIDAADIVGGALTGVATVGADGTAAIDVALAADETPEGEETLTLALDGQDASAAVIVNDTSTEAPAVNVIESTEANETLEGTAGVDNFVYDYAGTNMTDTEGAITTGAGAGLDGDDNVISFVAGTDQLTFNDPTGTIATQAGFESAGVEFGYNFDGDVTFKFTDSNSNELNLFTVKGLLDIDNPDHVALVADDVLTIDEVITVIGADNIDFTDVGA